MLRAVSDPDEPPPRQFKFKPKEFERVNAPPGADAKSDDHDVFAIRRQVREREQAAGFDDVAPPPPRRSRRTRDFWLILTVGWGAAMTIGGLAGGRAGFTVGAGLGVPFGLALWWIFYHVLGNY